ncbi:hypothetical protein ABZ896_42760 [Streptomyces sp. NPDC047072]|uniref:hypothetical protein n=1 Tax=Streptomyces sp. NPDC047072 TaxID=3154809 RepID=UPI0033EC8320
MSGQQSVHSVARVAATLRTVLASFREGGDQALPLLVGDQEGGEPEAAILPYDLFVLLLQAVEHADDVAISNLAAQRMSEAPDPGQGLDTSALARLVAGANPDHADEILKAGGASAHEV